MRNQVRVVLIFIRKALTARAQAPLFVNLPKAMSLG